MSKIWRTAMHSLLKIKCKSWKPYFRYPFMKSWSHYLQLQNKCLKLCISYRKTNNIVKMKLAPYVACPSGKGCWKIRDIESLIWHTASRLSILHYEHFPEVRYIYNHIYQLFSSPPYQFPCPTEKLIKDKKKEKHPE